MGTSFLANICAGFSFVGMVFLVFVAIVMGTQPLFLRLSPPRGIRPIVVVVVFVFDGSVRWVGPPPQ